jgi:putative transcriptional regulator
MFKQKSVYIHIRKEVVSVFQNNLKALRMKKGLSQGELAIRLNVVRQTVSKWEKGVSVPDAETLIKLADLLDTSVNDLLGSNVVPEDINDMNKIADQLVRVNEQLAIKNNRARRIWKIVVITIAVFVFLMFVIARLNYMPPQ